MNLQKLLTQTQENYELIPFFIEQLLASDVYCLAIQNQEEQIQFRVLETEEGEQAIPFFLSEELILQDLGHDAEYISLNTRKLFEMTLGATLVMNPTSELSKEFQPEDVKAILDIENES
jgi:hypothetical protein